MKNSETQSFALRQPPAPLPHAVMRMIVDGQAGADACVRVGHYPQVSLVLMTIKM